MFNPLVEAHIISVVHKFIHELQEQLAEKKLSLEASDKAVAWLAKKGFDEKLGARPMERMIKKYVKEPLANKIIFDNISKGTRFKISMKGKNLDIKAA